MSMTSPCENSEGGHGCLQEPEQTVDHWLRSWRSHIVDLGEQCTKLGSEGFGEEGATLSCTVALPAWIRPMDLWQASGARVRWVPPTGTAAGKTRDASSGLEVTGLGVAFMVTAQGANRWASVRQQGAEILEGIVTVSHSSVVGANSFPRPAFDPGAPRLFGGFSFRSGDQEDAGWSEFGEATFFLPEMCILRAPGSGEMVARITMSSRDGGLEERLARVMMRFEKLADLGSQEAHGKSECETRRKLPVCRSSAVERRSYVERVRRAVNAIQHGTLQKVVVARSSLLEVGSSSEADLLGEVEALNPNATTFAFGVRAALFFGATPESLVAVDGRAVRTEALAGTMPSAGQSGCRTTRMCDATSSALGSSRKDAEEHGLVVDDVLRRLQPLCSVLGTLERRQREAGPVVHLNTQIRGKLLASQHVVDVAARLHPTPAVGGVPRQAALSWIKENEGLTRGWYAAPFGWFEASGSGEFRVALRSALLLPEPSTGGPPSGTRRDAATPVRRALLFAGAGIVGASQPERESEETELKFEALRPALRSVRLGEFE